MPICYADENGITSTLSNRIRRNIIKIDMQRNKTFLCMEFVIYFDSFFILFFYFKFGCCYY